MANLRVDDLDKKLINLVQSEFPLTKDPYATLGRQLAISEHEVILRIDRLKAMAIIRLMGPVLDTRSLGYQSTLVAMSVTKDKLDEAERIIAEHPRVSHGYERNHRFNLWFTLATPIGADIETELTELTSPIVAEAVFSLPATRVFKIGAYFDMGENGQGVAGTPTSAEDSFPKKVELSPKDKLIIRKLQQDLPLVPTPFTAMAEQSGISVEDFLAHCQSLLKRGIMRRFGASINHNNAGYKANAMTCWIVPSDMVDVAGRELARLQQVSHCYERRTNPLWHYNLFAMIHGRSRGICQEVVTDISHKIGLADYVLLYSTKEFKKTRINYLV
ncbi:Lrp/AsnC family transcriptional regulator [Chloroflexota bacterium]